MINMAHLPVQRMTLILTEICATRADWCGILFFLQMGEATTHWKPEKEVRLNSSEELESAIGGLVAVGTRSRAGIGR